MLGYFAFIERRYRTVAVVVATWIMINGGIPVAIVMLLNPGGYSVIWVQILVALAPAATIVLWAAALLECRRVTRVVQLPSTQAIGTFAPPATDRLGNVERP